jgi:hypothetical protein
MVSSSSSRGVPTANIPIVSPATPSRHQMQSFPAKVAQDELSRTFLTKRWDSSSSLSQHSGVQMLFMEIGDEEEFQKMIEEDKRNNPTPTPQGSELSSVGDSAAKPQEKRR